MCVHDSVRDCIRAYELSKSICWFITANVMLVGV